MPTLALTNFNIVVTVLGGWISLFGLVSYLVKENFYLSEALISLLAGIIVSPSGANLISPISLTQGSPTALQTATLAFSRLVLGVQLVLAGVQLPSRYLRTQWRPLSLLLGPIMVCMWMSTSLLVWALVPSLSSEVGSAWGFVHALAVGACVTPTDPVLSAVVVKGRWAEHNVPTPLVRLIVAESGANDGLGYPFLFFALWVIKEGGGGGHEAGWVKKAMALWFGETWGYVVLLSVAYGAAVGFLARLLLRWARERKYVDRESFLVFAVSLALFIVGTCGMIGTDDVLACFIAGNVFTWDDWFRLETLDDSLQPTIDMLLNVSIFMWYGAVCPWTSFLHNEVVPIYRLVGLGILVLLLRRLPFILGLHKMIPQIENINQAVFVGFFGPVGVSAVFYLIVAVEFVETLKVDGEPREDVKHLAETITVVVWFLVICSVIVHGLSIPVGKLGVYLPRTISRSLSIVTTDGREPLSPFQITNNRTASLIARQANADSTGSTTPASTPRPGAVYRLGGTVIPRRPEEAPSDSDRATGVADDSRGGRGTVSPAEEAHHRRRAVPEQAGRAIRFDDELSAGTTRAAATNQ